MDALVECLKKVRHIRPRASAAVIQIAKASKASSLSLAQLEERETVIDQSVIPKSQGPWFDPERGDILFAHP